MQDLNPFPYQGIGLHANSSLRLNIITFVEKSNLIILVINRVILVMSGMPMPELNRVTSYDRCLKLKLYRMLMRVRRY